MTHTWAMWVASYFMVTLVTWAAEPDDFGYRLRVALLWPLWFALQLRCLWGSQMGKRPSTIPEKADYGLDAPYVVRRLQLGAVLALPPLACLLVFPHKPYTAPLVMACVAIAVGGALESALMAASSYYGKLVLREHIMASINWAGSEHVLDVGCGSGLLTVGAARRLDRGTVIGVDLWKPSDQSGASPQLALHNAMREGVAHRVAIQPDPVNILSSGLEDESFDVVFGGHLYHNVGSFNHRLMAVMEMVRVLKPGGRVVFTDYRHTGELAKVLVTCQCEQVSISNWVYAMFPPVRIVTAVKPLPGGTPVGLNLNQYAIQQTA